MTGYFLVAFVLLAAIVAVAGIALTFAETFEMLTRGLG